MHGLYIAEMYRLGAIFLPLIDSVGLSDQMVYLPKIKYLHSLLHSEPQKAIDIWSDVVYHTLRYKLGHSMSSKFIPIESPYAISY